MSEEASRLDAGIGAFVLNPFPKSLKAYWGPNPPRKKTIQHYEPWNVEWEEGDGHWYQSWELGDLKTYYLFHLLLHELGHINQPPFSSPGKKEAFAEDFALTWARKLKVLRKVPFGEKATGRKRMTTKNIDRRKEDTSW